MNLGMNEDVVSLQTTFWYIVAFCSLPWMGQRTASTKQLLALTDPAAYFEEEILQKITF